MFRLLFQLARGPALRGARCTCLAFGLLLAGACSSSESGHGAAATPAPGGGAPAGADPAAQTEDEQDAIAVRVGTATQDSLSSLYNTSATLRADQQATVTARTRGVVRRLLVEEGDPVRAGQELAILDNEEQQIELDRARTTRDTQVREYERALSLHQQGLTSDEAFEMTRREAEESSHTAALAELMLDRTVIRAPFAGTILRRHIDAGATVSDGTAVYDLADVSPLYADVNVPERQIARLGPGQKVRLSTDAATGAATTAAVIERIAPQVDPATGTVKVTLAVTNAPGMRPGSFVRVAIVTDTHSQALVVPRAALVAEGRRWHLFRVGEENKVQRLEIERGFEEGDRVEILGTLHDGVPLSPGDTVVVVGASALTDGAKVQATQDEDEVARVAS